MANLQIPIPFSAAYANEELKYFLHKYKQHMIKSCIQVEFPVKHFIYIITPYIAQNKTKFPRLKSCTKPQILIELNVKY